MNFGKGGTSHANAECVEKMKRFLCAKGAEKLKSDCQISVFLASGTKIQGLLVS